MTTPADELSALRAALRASPSVTAIIGAALSQDEDELLSRLLPSLIAAARVIAQSEP